MKGRSNIPKEVESNGPANEHDRLPSQATTQLLVSMVIITRPQYLDKVCTCIGTPKKYG